MLIQLVIFDLDGTLIDSLGVSAALSLFVGDTPIDMKTGRNAGTRTVGVTWGFRDAHELFDAGADHMIHEPLGLLEFLDAYERRGLSS